MANHSLAHIDVDSYYQIAPKDLEDLHFKVDQTYSVLSFFTDWVAEGGSCSLPMEDRGRVMPICFLLMDLMEQAKKLLPEV